MLAAALPGCRLHALDNPGVGTERHRRAPCSLADTSADLLRRFHARRADKDAPWGVVGISLGGMLALEIAARADQGALRCAVAINSSGGRGFARPWERLRPRAAWGLLRAVLVPAHARDAIVLPLVRRFGSFACWPRGQTAPRAFRSAC